MEKLLNKLKASYSQFRFKIADKAYWSPKNRTIYFVNSEGSEAQWALLHELAHGILEHKTYSTDIDLLHKEVDAWEHAKDLAQRFAIKINDEHIEQCLDTYRDWLHKRSECPACKQHGVEVHRGSYSCMNCQNVWKVSSERFCRPYRLKIAVAQ